jgi:HPt (histidine-containing phosphotransfer) domain-containing protein
MQRDEFEDKDVMKKFTVAVHGIKSSLWSIGETTLSEFAKELEFAGRERHVDQITSAIPEFVNKLGRLLERLEAERI